jgi:hypothetical protein
MSERPFVPLDAFTHPRDHSSRVVPLWVNGSPPLEMSLSDHTLAFGGRLINSPSDPLVLIVTNSGFLSLNIETVTITGEQFSIQPILPRELEAGKIMAIPVTFRPTEFGVNYGTLVITTKEGLTKKIRLLGAGIWDYVNAVDNAIEKLWAFLKRATQPALTTNGPLVDLSNTGVEFKGETLVGEESDEFVFVINNAGNQPLVIDNITVTGEFELVP